MPKPGRPKGRQIPESEGIDPRPLRSAAYSPPMGLDTTPAEAVHQLEELGLLLRMRKVARLERMGLLPDKIAVELSKGHETWPIELILTLMGLGDAGTPAQREILRSRYRSVLEETSQAELTDPERELAENQNLALGIVKYFLQRGVHERCAECGCAPKESFEGALKVLRMSGVGLAENITVREFRMDPDTLSMFREFLRWKPPESRLKPMIEADLVESAS